MLQRSFIVIKFSTSRLLNGHQANSTIRVFSTEGTANETSHRRSVYKETYSPTGTTVHNPITSHFVPLYKTNAEKSALGVRGYINAYLQLSKCRLTMLITSTAVAGYFMQGATFSIPIFATCLIGTTLLSASACSLNNILEVPYDAQMKRTQSRVLVIDRISVANAFAFAGLSATAGLGILCLGCNPLTSGLGALNLGLYALVYTPLKRRHLTCTWAGAIVGAIPPLMGYTAATGTLDAAGLVLAGILYSWQFPHFNGLSWNLRGDYKKAGYKMMCVTNEGLCRRTTLRHSLALLALCSIAPLADLTSVSFALTSLPLNLLMVYFAHKFYSGPDSNNSKLLFRYTLLYLPLLMVLLIMSRSQKPVIGSETMEIEAQLPDLKQILA